MCQVCGIEISARGVTYAEAPNIRPLGKPHNGKDKPGNLICLCPNHRVIIDKGVFSIELDLTLKGIDGRLSRHEIHKLLDEDLAITKNIFI